MIKPIQPHKVKDVQLALIPDEVIDVFNTLIIENYDKSTKSADVSQNEAIERISVLLGISRCKVFDNKWMDIEDVFRKAGWKVTYVRPAYYERGSAYYIFNEK